MKKSKGIVHFLLALTFAATMATPLFACNSNANKKDEDAEKQNAHTISASLLDGKVANLLSASGIAIQDKTQNEGTVSAMKGKSKPRNIVASAEEIKTITQPETELVKETEEGLKDVHFHEEDDGDYTQWNNAYEVHHHDGEPCEVENCAKISDEIIAEEEAKPTIVSLDARVNKLYNAGKYTFLCVSSAVEGQVGLLTEVSTISMNFSQKFYMNYGAWLNVEDHFYSEEKPSFTVSYMRVQTEDKKGIILVKRSEAETGYHYSNYWSDDFNQSYLIDNETGITYSLSALPHIYSVQNGTIHVKGANGASSIYQPKIVEGELVLEKIEIPEEVAGKYETDRPLIDIYGNVLFKQSAMHDVDEYGEIREAGFIFAGHNTELAQALERQQPYGHVKAMSYSSANRYVLGSDGRIYRFDFRGETNSISVHVLNEQGEWTDVPNTAHVIFSGDDCWFTQITVNAAKQQYMLLTEIRDGKTYFSNAALGQDLRWTMNTLCALYNEIGYFVGVTALPIDGSPDTAMQEFMSYIKTTGALDDDSIVYRVGTTAFAYEDKSTNELVIWDRATETKQRIAVGEVIENNVKGWHLSYMRDDFMHTCFQANTADGTYYLSYEESNSSKAWKEYSTSPIEKVDTLDAYYRLLTDKENGPLAK